MPFHLVSLYAVVANLYIVTLPISPHRLLVLNNSWLWGVSYLISFLIWEYSPAANSFSSSAFSLKNIEPHIVDESNLGANTYYEFKKFPYCDTNINIDTRVWGPWWPFMQPDEFPLLMIKTWTSTLGVKAAMATDACVATT